MASGRSVKVSTYMKNVARSFGYALGDTFSEYNPVISSIGKEAKSSAQDIYQNIKSIKAKVSDTDEGSLKGKAKGIIDDTWNNFKEDIKSGNWYNKQRKDQADTELAKALGFDFDMDFDFDFDDEDYDESSVLESDQQNTAKVISAVDQVGSALSNSINTTTVEAASYVVRSQSKSARALYALNERGFTAVNNSIGALNSTIGSFAQIVEPLSQHMQNSAVFYTKTTETLDKMYQSIAQIEKNTTPAPLSSNGRRNTVKGKYTDLFDVDGGFSLDTYKEMVKDNFKDYKDMLDMALGAVKGAGGATKHISVMQYATTMVTKVMIPKVFKESMKNFNEDLKNFVSGGMLKLREKDGGLFFELFKEMFLPKDSFRRNISTSNYEKGAVAWDGISRKALVEVIPTTLLKIYSAITGAPEQVFDYKTGKLTTIGNIRKEKRQDEERYARRAGEDFRDDALAKVSKNSNLSDAQKAQLTKEIEDYFYNAFMKGSGFTGVNNKDFNAKEFGLSNESLAIIRELVNATDPKSRKNRGRFVNNIGTERSNYGDYIRGEEASGNSNQVHLGNGFFSEANRVSGKGLPGTDKYNHTTLSYLRGIYLSTGLVADNLKFIAGKSDRIDYSGMRRRSTGKNRGEESFSNNTSTTNGGDRTRAQANASGTNPSGFMDAVESLDEDAQRIKDNEERQKELKSQAKGKFKSIAGKVAGFFRRDNPSGLFAFYNRPFNAVANLLNNIGVSMDRFLWGEKNDDPESIFGYIKRKTKENFEKFSKWMDDKFKIKDKWDKLKKKMLGFEVSEVKDQDGNILYTKTENGWVDVDGKPVSESVVERANGGPLSGEGVLKGAKNQFHSTMSNVASSLGRTAKQIFKGRDNGTAAHGRRVTKSGIVAVSEGELIIPSELNPFYHGATNKAAQVRNEERIVKNFYGSFADGGMVGGLKGIVKEGASRLGSGASTVFNQLFGDGTKESAQREKNIIGKVSSKLASEAGENLGAMGAGALLGAGTSIVTGAVVGPLLGAGIGAAVGLVANSKTVRHILFGADPETGEINGGLLSKNVSEFMMKKVPSLAKGGALGAAAGLFMGSPVMGAIAGTAISYVSSSEKAKAWLFGEGEKDNGVISKKVQEKIKGAIPSIAIGSIAGLVAGPFGIAGNLVFGGALGYLSTSEKFKTWMFGDGKDDKGFVGLVKTKIIDNLDITFHNIGSALSGWSKNLMIESRDRIRDFFTKRARAYENGENQGFFGKLIGGAVSKTGSAVKGVTSGVGNMLGGIARRTQAHNLRKGYNVYGVGEDGKKKYLTADERLKIRSNGTFGEFDKLLAKAKSPEELNELKELLQNAKDPNAVFKREMNSVLGSLYSALEDQDPKEATKIGKLIEKGANGNTKAIEDAISRINALNLTPEKRKQALDAVKVAQAARRKADSSRQVLKNFKSAGMNFGKNGNLNNALDRIDDELKNRKDLTPEEQEKLEQKDWRSRVIRIIESIEAKMGGGSKKSSGEVIIDEDGNEYHQNSAGRWVDSKGRFVKKEVVDKAKKNSKPKSDKEKPEEREGIRSEIDMLGNVHQYMDNNQGEMTEVNNDNETKKSRKIIDKFMNSVNNIPLLGGALGGLVSLFGKKKDDKEKKEGLLSKLFGEDGIFGENGFFGGITKFFKGKSFTEGLGMLLRNVAAPAMFGLAFTGALDGILNKLLPQYFGKKDSEGGTVYENKETGEVVTKDENGNYVDKNGNTVDFNSVRSRSGDIDSFGERIRKNTARGILTGTKSVGSVVLGRTGLGKSIARGAGNFGKALAGDTAAIAGVGDSILDGCIKVSGALRKVKVLAPIADKLDDMFLELADKATQKLASGAGEKLLKNVSNFVVWAKIAFVAIDFTTGMEDARTTLSITDEPTFGQKLISGLIRVVKNCIPVIGSLIPDNMVVDLFCKYVAPALGISVEELMGQRKKALEDLANYNAATGSNIQSVGEFNKTVLKDYTWTERIGNTAKNTWNNTKDRFNNMKKGIQEKGFGGYMAESMKTMGSDFMASYKDAGGGIAGIFSGVGKTFENLLPGVLGEIAKKNSDIRSLAFQGKLKELWSISLDDFSGGGEKVEGTDLTTAVPSTFSKIIGQIPLIVSKISMTPVALFSGILGKAKDGVMGAINKIIEKRKVLDDFKQREREYGEKIINDTNSNFSDFFKFENEDPENPFNGFTKGIAIANRLTAIPIAIVKKVGKDISGNFNKAVEKVKAGFNGLKENEAGQKQLALEGKVIELLNHKPQDDPENPLNGIMGGIDFIRKLHNVPLAMVSWVGRKLFDGFKAMTEKTKSNHSNLDSSIEKLKKFAQDGDPKSIMNMDIEFDKGDPLHRIWSAGFTLNKWFQAIIGLFNKIAGPVGEALDKVKGVVSKVVGDNIEDTKETVSNIKNSATSGTLTSKAANWVGNKASNAWNSFTSWVSGGASGMYNNQFVSQFDQRYKDRKFGSSTVGEKGCGPAVATMLANSYGINTTMDDALKAATPYQDKNGTKASFFKDYLGQAGLEVNQLTGKDINAEAMQALANGNQLILLGQDAKNTSKKNSPFGPNAHYVIASGIDKNGNIIIKDPEGNGPRSYNPNILKSIKAGFNTNGSGGAGNYDTDIAKKVWAYFTSLGYSPAATAGIMGNLYGESGMDPTRHQMGGGPAAGIAQWEKYGAANTRWGQLDQFAKSKGYVWSDLDPQLQFIHKELTTKDIDTRFAGGYGMKSLNNAGATATTYNAWKQSKDVEMATRQFEGAFERAGKPRMDSRIAAATEYYKLYHDKNYTYTPSESTGAIDSGNTSGSTDTTGVSSEGSTTGKVSYGGFLSAIGSVFSTALGKIFGDNSSDSTSTGSSVDGAVGGVTSGVASGGISENVVDGITGPGNEKQKALAQKLLGIKGQLSYSMSGARNPEKGSADCSSTVNWAYKKVTGTDIGNNTQAILTNGNTDIIDLASGIDKNRGGKNGSGPNLSKLMPGDIMLYSRPDSGYSSGRPYRVGHVEMYIGNGQRIGHGGGMGPKVTDANKDASRYIMAKRLKGITDGDSSASLSAAGSGLYSYDQLAGLSGGSSGILLKARPGTKVNGGSIKRLSMSSYSGGDSALIEKTKNMLNNVASDAKNRANNGSISADVVEKLLNAIIKVLESIASNTSPVDKIYQLLAQYTKISIGNDAAKASALSSAKSNDNNSELDNNIVALVGQLAQIAKG